MKYIIYTYHIQIAGNQKIKKIILEEVKVKKKKKTLPIENQSQELYPISSPKEESGVKYLKS